MSADATAPLTLEFRAKSALRFAPDVTVAYDAVLEVSLACPTCQRNHRPVRVGAEGASCLKAAHPFEAKVRGSTVESKHGLSVVSYDVVFVYRPFFDATSEEASVRYPRWGRIGFRVTCGACGKSSPHATQTNMKRPWLVACACGRELYTEAGQLPLFEIQDAR